MPQSDTAALFGAKVEEVIGNVLMTSCDCDDCAVMGFCGSHVVVAAVGK